MRQEEDNMKKRLLLLIIAFVLSSQTVQAKPLTNDARWTATSEIKVKKSKPKFKAIKDCKWSKKTQKKIKKICDKYNISFELCIAQAKYESDFNPNCNSDNGASYGAWQIQPYQWLNELRKWGYEPDDMYNLLDCCDVYCRIMQSHFEVDEDIEWALMAYNCGSGRAKQLLRQGYVNNYTKRVIATAEKYERR